MYDITCIYTTAPESCTSKYGPPKSKSQYQLVSDRILPPKLRVSAFLILILSLSLSSTISHLHTMGDQPSAQITNTLFPPPPEYFKLFTDENAERYDKLTTRAGSRSPHPNDSEGGRELTTEEGHELDRLRGSLGRPRPDWIREEGRWVTFGEMSTVSLPYFTCIHDTNMTNYDIAMTSCTDPRHEHTSLHRPI